MSGLRAVKRDWSTPSVDTDPIPWSSSPPHPSDPPTRAAQAAATAPAKSLSAAEKRLKLIQDALDSGPNNSRGVLASSVQPNANKVAGSSGSSLRASTSTSTSTSSNTTRPPAISNKRSSESQESSSGPASKKRSLPESWSGSAATSQSSVKSASSASYKPSTKLNGPEVIKIAPSTDTGKVPKVFLSKEQQKILKLVEDGQSIFYTGSAGTGKSVLLREIIKTMQRKHAKSYDAVAITASTGLAACNIGGMTIHSFAGIGLGLETAEELAVKIKKNKKAVARWLRTKVLIVDEVSMVEADLLDKLCKIGSILTRRPTSPFGGMQLVVTGDFFQLPPVVKSGETRFAFEAECWPTVIKRTFNLQKVFRQSDPTFVNMLNEMRFGQMKPESVARFKALAREVKYEDGINATELFPRREEVDRSNHVRMTSLQTEQHTYVSTDAGRLEDERTREKLLANFMAAKTLQLRVGAQVMLIKNMDELLVNGSMGKIVRFIDPAVHAHDKGEDDKGEYTFGKDGSKGGPGPAAGAGTGAAGKKKTDAPIPSGVVWPIVQFATPKGHVDIMVEPATWKVELPSGEVQVSRTQLPLILSWAMSIHKSQGQTLERVKVDLGKIFEKGQAYVALSRATSLDRLQVLNFDASKVNAHPKVVAWSKTLEAIEA